MGSGAGRPAAKYERSHSGGLYRKGSDSKEPQLVTAGGSIEGLRELRAERELAHPSRRWKARLLAAKSVEVLSCKWSPDDQLIAASYFDGGVRLWDARDGSLLHTQYLDDSEDQENVDRGIKYHSKVDMLDNCTTCLQWKHGAKGEQRQLLAVDTDGFACIFGMSSSSSKAFSETWRVKADGSLRTCDWFHGGEDRVAVGGYNKTISVYDLETTTLLTVLKHKLTVSNRITGHTKRIHSVRCAAHDPNVVLTAAWDHAALLWDVRSGYVVRAFTAPDLVMNGGTPADLSTSGDMVVTSSDMQAGDVALWDSGGRGIVAKVPCAFSRPTSVQFSKDIESSDIAVAACGVSNCGWLRRDERSNGTARRQEESSDEEDAKKDLSQWSLKWTARSPIVEDGWAVDWAHRSKKVCVGSLTGAVAILSL